VVYLSLTWLLAATSRFPPESARFAIELGLLYLISIYSVNGVSDRIVSREVVGIGVAVVAGLGAFAIGAGAALYAGAGVHAVVLAYVGGKIVEVLLLLRGRARLLHVAPRHMVAMSLALWPFSIQAILAVIYSRLSVFIVEHFRHADMGLLGVATALQNVFLLLPVSIGLLKYPIFTTAAARGEIGKIRSALTTAAAMSFAAVGAGVVVLIAGRDIVGRALHVEASSMPFVMAFAAIAALTTGTALAGLLLQSLGHERVTAKLSFVTLTVSLVSQYTFVQWLGLWGVAAGIALAELVSVAVFGTAAYRAMRRRLVRPPAEGAGKNSAAAPLLP
jgi:O-antigen/teichoic acid export membrane protein